ncbi:nitrite reductase small subunit NirD [Nitrobacter sp. JJSN]|jgi:nitrite reductase (NADH) small subunit|uniref:nitrite reductase small subunit NirD n=1 Tax=Nitrobacter sp. JJSN TaxID=3453033 RepID=UPI003F75BAC3
MSNWKNIGPLSNIPVRGARRLCMKHLGKPVAVFRTSEDDIFALVDECPHKQGPLSEGIVAGRTVSCPLHNWVIGLDDGQALAPDEGTAQPLSVRVVEGDVYVYLPEALGAAA